MGIHVDPSVVLNSNPSKRLRIVFENLKSNYSENGARQYAMLYEGKDPTFILENSEYIFTEPMYGCGYYQEQMQRAANIPSFLVHYPDEYDKVHSYLEANKDAMSEEQLTLYENLDATMKRLVADTSHMRAIAYYEEDTFTGLDADPLTTSHPVVFLSQAPFLLESDDPSICMETADRVQELYDMCMIESAEDEDWKAVFEAITACHMLSSDPIYMEACQNHREIKKLVDCLAMESIQKQRASTRHITRDQNVEYFEYVSPMDVINRIRYASERNPIYEAAHEEERIRVDSLDGYTSELLHGMALYEYMHCDPSIPSGIDASHSVDAYYKLAASDYATYEAVEDDDEDFEDEEEPEASKKEDGRHAKEQELPTSKDSRYAAGTTARVIAKSTGNLREDPVEKRAPKKKLAFKIMDRNSKYHKKMAKAKRKLDDAKGTVDAAMEVPKHVQRSMEKSIEKWDQMDDERRQRYMTKPGFRKKAFRNLKLGILYGTTARLNALMLPVVMICRKFSKDKDRRIRNQLIMELKNEIEICKTKIDDAAADNNTKEKYQLMRIKGRLEQEYARVLKNSKYI